MEMVGDINLVIPNLIAIFVSRGVADQLSKPLFKYQLDAKVLPYLDQEPKVLVAGKQYVTPIDFQLVVLFWLTCLCQLLLVCCGN